MSVKMLIFELTTEKLIKFYQKWYEKKITTDGKTDFSILYKRFRNHIIRATNYWLIVKIMLVNITCVII